MKKCRGARRKAITSDLPALSHPFRNEIVDGQLHHRPTYDGENGFDEEENDDFEEDDRKSGGENNGDDERPKLAEGFYEIEALLKKRIRKGVKQYLIKWRGWPESANTWEPVESLASCPDVVEAFESMNSGKRKRKRKHSVGPSSQSKKKQQQQQQQQESPDAACDIPSVGIKVEESCHDPCVSDSKVTETDVEGASPNGTANQSNGLDNKLVELKPTSPVNQENTTEFAIHIQEDPVKSAIADSKVDATEILRASPRTGARRRKSCAVKRYKKELNSISKEDFTKKTAAASDVVVEDNIKSADRMVNGLDSANVLDTPRSVSVVTKILKPVNYTISTLNDTEEVCVSFLVARSDGKEIVVDNKYLKENNPILLINFYEQHLRYNSPSE